MLTQLSELSLSISLSSYLNGHAQEDGGPHGDHVDDHEVARDELGLEEAEVPLVLEAVEGRVEDLGGEGGGDAAEEHLQGGG